MKNLPKIILPKNRTSKNERELLSQVVKDIYDIPLEGMHFFDNLKNRSGNYDIVGLLNKKAFKLAAGRRYLKHFETYSPNEALTLINDYKLYYSHLLKYKIKIPKLISIHLIPAINSYNNISGNLVLEVQQKIKGENLLNLSLNPSTSQEKIISEYHNALTTILKILPYIGDLIGIDTQPSNFLEKGYFIDLWPPKLVMGQEYSKLQSETNDKFSRIKLTWFFSKEGLTSYFLGFFSLILPDLIEVFAKILI